MSWRVAASSLSLPFMNFEANASMFLPSVTSVTLDARAASSFSTGGGRGSCEVCANALPPSATIPSNSAARANRMLRFFIGTPLLSCAAVVGR